MSARLRSFTLLAGAFSLATLSVSGAGCATAFPEQRDAARGVDAPLLYDGGTPRDTPIVPGIDTGMMLDPDGGPFPDPDTGVPPDLDGGVVLVDAPVLAVDAGPPPDAPGDRCAGVSCTSLDGPCTTGVCNPATGACMAMPRGAGFLCDDGNRCTTGDSCLAGVCQPGAALDCSAMTTACGTGTCNGATGSCTVTPAADGTVCGGVGCGAGSCMSGACVMTGAPDCASCGTAMYCSAGACGANPTTLTYDFESGAMPSSWTNGVGGTTGWSVVSGGAHGGTYRARSGAIGNSAQSRLSFTITLASAASLSFWLTTSTEATYDKLDVLVDGVVAGTWSGTNAWLEASINLAPGTRTIEFRYTKDGSLTGGSDVVSIDDLTIGLPSSPNTGFESTTLPAGYTSTGSGSWITDTTMPHAGARSAASADIADSQTTSMLRTVSLPSASSLTYWYRVSSESGYDYLRVFIDGAMAGQWSGTVAWTMASHALSAGSHTIEWRYSKDATLSTGSDRAWIDDVDFGFTPTGGPLCGP